VEAKQHRRNHPPCQIDGHLTMHTTESGKVRATWELFVVD
jgi:hypothetical protein